MSPILKTFNSKIQTLNHSGSKQMLLSAKEARDLHTEIFNLLSQISALESKQSQNSGAEITTVNADGGKF